MALRIEARVEPVRFDSVRFEWLPFAYPTGGALMVPGPVRRCVADVDRASRQAERITSWIAQTHDDATLAPAAAAWARAAPRLRRAYETCLALLDRASNEGDIDLIRALMRLDLALSHEPEGLWPGGFRSFSAADLSTGPAREELDRAVEAASRCAAHPTTPANGAICLAILGHARAALGDLTSADALLERAAESAEGHVADYVHVVLGEHASARGDLDAMRRHAEQVRGCGAEPELRVCGRGLRLRSVLALLDGDCAQVSPAITDCDQACQELLELSYIRDRCEALAEVPADPEGRVRNALERCGTAALAAPGVELQLGGTTQAPRIEVVGGARATAVGFAVCVTDRVRSPADPSQAWSGTLSVVPRTQVF